MYFETGAVVLTAFHSQMTPRRHLSTSLPLRFQPDAISSQVMMAPRSLLTPPRAAQAPPPNTTTPSGLPRRRQVHERQLDLVPLGGGEAPLAEELTTVGSGSLDAFPGA